MTRITVAHSPDSDDAFMFYGLAISASERATGSEFSVDGPDGVMRLLNCLDGPKDNRRA